MPNKIDEQLHKVATEGRKGLMTHVVVGYPSLNDTIQIVKAMEEAGADLVEMQIPFSDPLADGPTIQHACEKALAGGTTVQDAFTAASTLTKDLKIPLLFMSYFNTVFKYGVDQFCKDAAAAGITGLIVPDVPLEAAQHESFLDSCQKYNLHNIVTFAPTTTDERLQKNAKIASGFVYCMARQGVTGAGSSLDPQIEQYLQRVRNNIDIPMAVGFGISNREKFKIVTSGSDVGIVGSALIDIIDKASPEDRIPQLQSFIRSLLHD